MAIKNTLNPVLTTMHDRFKQYDSVMNETVKNQVEDFKFLAGDSQNNYQWPSNVLSLRNTGGLDPTQTRPTLTINRLPQHHAQVANDIRQNRPAGKVIPVDDKADPEVAEIYTMLVRWIETNSNADEATDTMVDHVVACGQGFQRLVTDWLDDDGFQQTIKIKRIRNRFSVRYDPLSQSVVSDDCTWWSISEQMTIRDYEKQYPKACKASDIESMSTSDNGLIGWVSDDVIRIAEYVYKEPKSVVLNRYPSGEVAEQGTSQDLQLLKTEGNPIRARNATRDVWKWVKTNGYEILEETVWPGKFSGLIMAVGNEFEIAGKMIYKGIVRNAMDAQRMYNYWVSSEAEMLALQPKAPWVGYEGQFDGQEEKWKTANVQAHAYLEANPDATDAEGRPLPLPQRVAPPPVPVGLIQAKAGASEDIKAATGQYNAALGQTSNERSAKAIVARDRQSETANFHIVDNVSKAIRYRTRQLIDLIPRVFDTAQVIQIIGEDQQVKTVEIDPSQQQAVMDKQNHLGEVIGKVYNLNIGTYDVVPTSGPSYATRRQEALESMSRVLETKPELWQVVGDLFAKNMDWPGAQEFAKRIRKTIPPEILDDNSNPALTKATQTIQEMAKQIEMLHDMLKQAATGIEQQKVNIDAFKAESERLRDLESRLNPEQIQSVVRELLIEIGQPGIATSEGDSA